MKKAFILLVFCVAALMLCPALAEEAAEENILVAANDRLKMYLSPNCCAIEIQDSLTGKTWSSTLNDETAAGMKIIPAQQRRVTSLLALNCTNLQNGLGVVNNLPLMGEKELQASYEPIENGVRLTYYYGSYNVGVKVDIQLDGASLVVSMPYDGIVEDGDFSLVSVDMMPFLFSATDLSEGFFLYPDGCGAVMYFQDYAHYREPARLYNVYGDFTSQPVLLDMFDQEAPAALFPVFGMNRGGSGLLAIIEDGAETARVSVNSSNNIIGINYMFANFQYRRSFEDKRVTTRDIRVFDKDDIKVDYRLRILFLEEEDPDYNVMAVTWRDYLLSTGQAVRKELTPTVAIDLFMSAPEEGLLFDTPRTVTTLTQAEEILRRLSAQGVTGIRASIKGWTADGYGKTPDRFPINGTVGSDADLKRLIETAHSLGATLSLTVNFMEASSDQRGYSHRNDVVYTGNHTILTNKEETVFMLSPDVAEAKLNDFLKRVSAFDLDGLRFERMGQCVAFNYSSRRYFTAEDTLAAYRRMAGAATAQFGAAEAEGGDTSLLGSVDFFVDVPREDAGYQITTAAVPFYQIALHGLVDYAGKPGNLSSDLEREVLRWVELGYTPFFELTWDNTEELMYTNYQILFSAEYEAWADRVAWAARQFTEGPLAGLHSQLILEHRRLTDTLVRVTYEDGTAVYVNYAEAPAEADGLTVEGMSWAVRPAQAP